MIFLHDSNVMLRQSDEGSRAVVSGQVSRSKKLMLRYAGGRELLALGLAKNFSSSRFRQSAISVVLTEVDSPIFRRPRTFEIFKLRQVCMQGSYRFLFLAI